MEVEIRTRSAMKSVIWRIFGILILGGVTFFYTRHWVQTTAITFIHHGVFLFVFYFHERIWGKFKEPSNYLARSLCKMFTYETICGNIILGLISYFITGSWKQMTQITITYIGIKHITYILNEFWWKQIKWGKTE